MITIGTLQIVLAVFCFALAAVLFTVWVCSANMPPHANRGKRCIKELPAALETAGRPAHRTHRVAA